MDRKGIRTALKNLLVTADIAGENVFTSRRIGISAEEELPSITIFTPLEANVPRDMRETQYIRNLELRIEARIKASDNSTDDDLDDLLQEIEDVVSENPDISGNCLGSLLVETSTELDEQAEETIGLGTLVYNCKYIK